MFLLFLDGIVAEERKSWLADVTTTDLLIQRHHELFHSRRAVKSHDLKKFQI